MTSGPGGRTAPGEGAVRIYTRGGDDGTTGLYGGGRLRKDDARIDLLGAVDEAQAALGLVRAQVRGTPLEARIAGLEGDLWVLMAEVACAPERRAGLEEGTTAVSAAMVEALEAAIDEAVAGLELEAAFAVPGETPVSAALDFSRTVVRRAERRAVGLRIPGSLVGTYLNRLSDLCWALARAEEHERRVNRRPRRRGESDRRRA